MRGALRRRGRSAARGWPRSKLEVADDHGVATAAEHRAIAVEAAVENAGTLARLKGGELAAPEPLPPKNDKRRVGGAGHRILVDAEIRDEHAAGDILALTARRDDCHA